MSSSSQWSIEQFYSKSWTIVKKQPIFWLFGLAALIYSGGASFNVTDIARDSAPQEKRAEFSEKIQNSNETALKEPPFTLNFDPMTQLTAVPVPIYLLLSVELLGLVVLSLSIAFVGMEWAKAAALKIFELFEHSKTVEIETVAKRAYRYIFPGMRYSAVASLISLAFGIVVIPVSVALIISFGLLLRWLNLSVIFSIVFAFLIIMVVIYFFIKMCVALNWGYFHLILDDQPVIRSAKLGWKQAQSTIGKSIKLLFVNGIASGIVSVLVFAPLLVLFAISFGVAYSYGRFAFELLPLFIVSYIIGFPIGVLGSAILFSVTEGTWYFAFQATKKIHQENTV